ncbi:MAG TPA: tetratricopeptide repeat protein [Candidatus Brocadiaceae bacterium]
MYTRLEDFKKASRYFENAIRYDPYNFETRCNLAEVYLKLNIIEKAEVEFKKILLITANHVEAQLGLGEVYTTMGDNGNADMYYQAINHFTAGINSSSPGKGSKELNKNELSAVLYSRGYSRVKLYEALPLLDKDKKLLRDAMSDFKECFKNDPNQYRAERAFEKIEKILENYSMSFMEKIGQCILFGFSLIILIGSQYLLYLFIRGKPRSIKESTYIILTFGSLLFIVASIYLPNVLKLKVVGLELEKNTINQINTLPTLKLEKIFSFDSGRR